MVSTIPQSWDYSDELEMLLLFYQLADELLSETTSDTYSLPLHNSMTLLDEITEVDYILRKYDMVDDYYGKYVPVIIDEFLNSVEQDYLLKKILGYRLETILTGFKDAKKNPILLQRWVESVMQACTYSQHNKQYRDEIVRLVKYTKDKTKLIYCVKNYFSGLIGFGYSREYLYLSTKRFFDNKSNRIFTSEQLSAFLGQFSCKKRSFDFLILMDIETVEYLDGISNNLTLSKNISKVDIPKDRKELCKDPAANEMFRDYDRKCRSLKKHQKISIIRYQAEALDEYRAIEEFENYISFLRSFSRYFKHYHLSRPIFMILMQDAENHFHEVKLKRMLLKRPYIAQQKIDVRIQNVIEAKAMSLQAFNSLAKALQMHSEALDAQNYNTLLRNFWTAMETLFSNPIAASQRENVINSILPIIQKTYILKLLRNLYSQLQIAIDKDLLESIGITSFLTFIEYFSSYSEGSEEMKKIYAFLGNNPLLRTRLFDTRKKLSSGKKIASLLDMHHEKIEWQLKRLYRTRNIATHVGEEMSYVEVVINHLHNYFDYAVNYVMCKSEKGDYVSSISALVFEAQNDNRIHLEMLKNDSKLSCDNFMELLFGPDSHLVNYEFES